MIIKQGCSRMKRAGLDVRVVNPETGEYITGKFIAYSRGGTFMKIWQGIGWEDKLNGLQGNSLKVLWHLVRIAKWGNIIPGSSEVARQMNWRQQIVSRAYRELIQASFLYRFGGVFKLSPNFCWKGDDDQYDRTCRELASVTIKQLTDGKTE